MPPTPLLLELPNPSDIRAAHVDAPRAKPARSGNPVSPALDLVLHAEQRNRQNGHENLGFLSLSHGFLPTSDPSSRLPEAFRAWDQVAAELPNLYATLAVRKQVNQLPLLDASKPKLHDRDVMRAAALLAILAHAYWYCQPTLVTKLPEVLTKPWAQLRARLGRRQEALTYIDLIVYNWRRKDVNGPLCVENLALLFPTIGNQEEQVFYLTQLEILARCTQVLRTMLIAQGAVLGNDADRLEAALFALSGQLETIVRTSLPKINPHTHSGTHVDAVTWAKTVAPFAVPIHAGDLGPSGTSSPIFNALDIFLGRKQYASFLGKEIQQLRSVYPPFWRAMMLALSRVNTAAYVANSKSASLQEAYKLANDAYAGEGGFLGRHRMKVYGFLELAFKVGRAVTIGGFGGAFKDRTWDQVDTELTLSRVERPANDVAPLPVATVTTVPGTGSAASTLHRLRLHIADGHRVHFQPGDHVQIWPSHRPELVTKTLHAVGATGDEPVVLTPEWEREFIRRRLSREAPTLGQLLPYAALKQLPTRAATTLLALHPNTWLRLAVEAGRCNELEAWQAFERLRSDGFPWDEILHSPVRCGRLFSPELPRTYSIASDAPRSLFGASAFDLTVRLHAHDNREGTASSFLCRARGSDVAFPFAIQKSASFGPLPPASTPVIAFAAGSGVGPMLSLFARRLREGATRNWLVLSVSRVEDFQFADDWHAAVSRGALRLDVVFTRQGVKLQHSPSEGFTFTTGNNRHVQDLVGDEHVSGDMYRWLTGLSGDAPAHVYVCGGASFSNTTRQCLEIVINAHADGTEAERKRRGKDILHELVGQGRLSIEAHTDAAPVEEDALFTPADVANHNSDRDGYWITVNDVVYDLTEFRRLHPGGQRIIDAYAGMDATHGFARAHNGRPDITAQLATYRKGRLYTPVFATSSVIVESAKGAKELDHAGLYRAYVTALNLCVEMQNALHIDLSLAAQVVHPGVGSTSPSSYVWARQAETHHRFLATYVSVLRADTLPNLELFTAALYPLRHAAPANDDAWLNQPNYSRQSSVAPPPLTVELSAAARSELALRNLEAAGALVTSATTQPREATLRPRITRLTELDLELLAELKELLRAAVNAIAYRQDTAESDRGHPLNALNATTRARLQTYELAVAEVG